ncbi:hypothetical protein D3C80_1028690 [compost metagenome]
MKSIILFLAIFLGFSRMELYSQSEKGSLPSLHSVSELTYLDAILGDIMKDSYIGTIPSDFYLVKAVSKLKEFECYTSIYKIVDKNLTFCLCVVPIFNDQGVDRQVFLSLYKKEYGER